jgi:glyoxylase-like metal-dependent hydrolase (beta-lactamase superfamily II)
MPRVTRRTVLGAGAALAAAAASPPPLAASAGGGPRNLHRYRIGDLQLTAVYDGIWHRPLDADFVSGAPFAEVQEAMRNAHMPRLDEIALPVTTLLIEAGTRRILIDTGTGGQVGPSAGAMTANLRKAGVSAAGIDMIVLSHFHFDHIDGLTTKDEEPVFPNAEIVAPAPDWAFWMDDANLRAAPDHRKREFLNVRRVFRDLEKKTRFFEPGAEVAPGILSVPAFGHTPGHTVFSVFSGRESVMVLGDTTDHPALFVRHPDWQPANDLDKPLAAATRHKILDRAAADRMLVQGYHFPFPGIGHIAKDGGGYAFIPAA